MPDQLTDEQLARFASLEIGTRPGYEYYMSILDTELVALARELLRRRLAEAPALPPLVYLASPYSHPDATVREQRFQAAACAAASLMRDGTFVYSPIAHTHPIALHGLPLGWDFWEQYDRAILARCTSVVVLQLDDWNKSKGVAAEIAIANELGLPVLFMKPSTDFPSWQQSADALQRETDRATGLQQQLTATEADRHAWSVKCSEVCEKLRATEGKLNVMENETIEAIAVLDTAEVSGSSLLEKCRDITRILRDTEGNFTELTKQFLDSQRAEIAARQELEGERAKSAAMREALQLLPDGCKGNKAGRPDYVAMVPGDVLWKCTKALESAAALSATEAQR